MAAATTAKSAQHRTEELVLLAGIKGISAKSAVTVAVPSITDPDIAKVDVDVAGVALGDVVLVAPLAALPTNARLQGAFVTATDKVTFVFGSEGGSVTGADKTFDIVIFDRT